MKIDKDAFEALKPEEQAKIFYQSSFEEKGELFPYCHSPELFVRSLSPEELYLMTRELDAEERSEVLRFANVSQLLFLSDIECWKKDRLDAKGFLGWLDTLNESGPARLLAWLEEADYEVLIGGFRKLVRVIKPQWEYAADELLGDEPYFTLDDQYYILAKEEELETVKQVIEKIYENHRGRYAALLESLIQEITDEMEEEAFRKREMRLAEHGFPDQETARRIYSPMSPEEFERFPLKRKGAGTPGPKDAAPPLQVPARWYGDRLFLDRVILSLKDESEADLEGIQEELVWLSNKVIACEGIDLTSEERVRQGVMRARSLVNIGLEDLSRGDVAAGRKILSERWLETIFRWGVRLVHESAAEAASVAADYWKSGRQHLLDFLEEPHHSVFQGLFRPVPLYRDAAVKGKAGPLRDFRSLEEVSRTRKQVREVRAAHDFLAGQFKPLFHRLNLVAGKGGRAGAAVKLTALAGTVFVHFVLEGEPRDEAVKPPALNKFLREAFEPGAGEGRRLKPALKEKFLSRINAAAGSDLRAFWDSAFDRLEEELARLDPKTKIDPRFVAVPLLSAD
ncbi:MAG: hypothetical protein HY714_00120 [Candidatus Omnitrophica bacterium]|nr:hypothetical protein [Candidatus Omnitrophota bacterium]